LDGVVVVADVETVRDRSTDRFVGPLVHNQLAAADLVIATKCDLAAPAEVADVVLWLEAASSAPAIRGDWPGLAAAVLGQTGWAGANRPFSASVEPPLELGFVSAFVAGPSSPSGLSAPLTAARVRSLIAQWPDRIVRVKGRLHLAAADGESAGPYLVERIGRRVSVQPLADPLGDWPTDGLVVIAVKDGVDGVVDGVVEEAALSLGQAAHHLGPE
jgi:G3E family GTPase